MRRIARSWQPRLTIRGRLTLTYTALLLGVGVGVIGVIYAFMLYVPSYTAPITVPATEASETAQSLPASGADEMIDGTAEGFPATSVLPITSQDDVLNAILLAAAVALVLLGGLGAWMGWLIAGRVLRPLQLINDAARQAGTGSLSHRVGLSGPKDEITELSENFDDMLERLDQAFAAHQRFAANASHELRTPLATTQTMIEVALDDPDLDAGQLRQLAVRLRHMNQRSIATVEALLDLADVEQLPLTTTTVDLAQTAADTLAQVQDEAAARSIVITSRIEAVQLTADPVLAHQLVKNLLENAVRHNTDGGTAGITVTAAAGGQWAEITVANSGRVVRDADIPLLTEPFYRGHGRAAGPGQRSHGIGLALVASIVKAHTGKLAITANPDGGLTVNVRLPLRRDA